MHLLEPGHLEEDCPIKMVSVNKRFSSFLANWPVMFIKLILSAVSWAFRKFKFKRLHCWTLNLIVLFAKTLGNPLFSEIVVIGHFFFQVPRFKIVALQLLGNLFNCFYFFNLLKLTDITCFCFYRQILLETFWINHLAKVVNHLASQR